jgi:hypothetical protein
MRCGIVSLMIMVSIASLSWAFDVEGRYERTVMVRNLEDGRDVAMVDFLEIEQRTPSEIFFVYESWHTNGHNCRLWGAARQRGPGVYEHLADADAAPGADPCRVLFYLADDNLVVEDAGGFCRASHCGARGEIGQDRFALKSRSPLKGALRVPW